MFKPLPPDDLERRLSANPELLKACPFCGRAPALHSAVQQMVRYLQRQVRYQSVVACLDPACFGQIMQTRYSRAEAQQAALAQWDRRAPSVA